MKGKICCVGVGPGDPELMTLKAVRLIRESDVVAVPAKTAEESVAYRIAAAAVPEISGKELLPLDMPMTRDRAALYAAHRECAKALEACLGAGRSVVYLTLGDPTVYCTFSYLQRILEGDGFAVEYVSGVTSFCAAAARLCLPLAEWDEPLHILPAAHMAGDIPSLPGNCVLMKAGRRIAETRDALLRSGREVCAVENCGMENERVFHGAEAIPDDCGYFTLVIAK